MLRRRYAAKFPGVMLPQPGLILNPWETDETSSESQSAAAGEMSPPTSAAQPSRELENQMRRAEHAAESIGSDYDFLADPGLVVANLVPDADGIVTVPADVIGGMPIVRVVVCDPATVIQTTLAGPLTDAKTRDLRIKRTLDPQVAYSMDESVSVASPQSPLDLSSLGSAQVQTIGSVAALLKLYKTLTSDPRLAEFDVLGRWDGLNRREKLNAYSRLACHELHVFLWAHDRPFFDEVIRPYLANKKEKQFVDDWLLDNNLSSYAKLWKYTRLNAAERAMLAMRVPELRVTIQRELSEIVEEQKVDHAAIRRSIESALKQNFTDKGLFFGESDFDAEVEAVVMPFGGAAGGMGGGFGGADPFAKDEFAVEANLRAESNGRSIAALRLKEKLGDLPETNLWSSLSRRRLAVAGAQFYRDLDTTRQWAESQWDQVQTVSETSSKSLIQVNGFWRDLATASTDPIDVSTHLLGSIDSRHAALLGLAFCGLPLTSGDIDLPSQWTTPYKPSHGVAVVTKRLRKLRENDEASPIMIGRRYTTTGDADSTEVTEFVTGVVYRGQSVLSNPTSNRHTVNVLWQLPAGSIPLGGTRTLDNRVVTLEPFAVNAITYDFYFPAAGEFNHYPTTVADDETLVAKTDSKSIEVVGEPAKIDGQTWAGIAHTGTAEEIARFLDTANLHSLDWNLVAHRMIDKEIYDVVIQTLASNHLSNDTLWAYSCKHADESAMRSFLSLRTDLVGVVGPVFESSLLSIHPIEQQTYEMLEYSPLVRARIHRLGESHEILDPTFLAHYRDFLGTLAYGRQVSPDQHLALAYYLLIQNRIEESIQSFDKVVRAKVDMKLQYDYMDAYLAMHRGDYDRAGKIASANSKHPVGRWNARFAELQTQLDQGSELNDEQRLVTKDVPEADEGSIAEGSGDLAIMDRQARQAAASEELPELIVRVEGNRLRIDHRRTRSATLNLYGVDLELLFSKAPFVREDLARMAMVRPIKSEPLEFDDSSGVATMELDKELRRQTLLVEVVSGASRSTVLSHGGNMTTYVSEAMGQLQTTDSQTGRPIRSAYVKVYAKYADGGVRFYKDGYTDARGRFDYASLSAADAKGATRLAILVLSGDEGTTLHDIAPPTR